MRIKVKPDEPTELTVVPSEDAGYVCALLIKNDCVDATLRMTTDDARSLVDLLLEYAQ